MIEAYYLEAYFNTDEFLFDADVMRRGNAQAYRANMSIEELIERHRNKEFMKTINRILDDPTY